LTIHVEIFSYRSIERESGDGKVRYHGRITATILILTAFFFEIVYFFLLEGYLYSPIVLLAAIPFAYLGWWLGERYDEARYAAIHDDLTNACNRRYAAEIFPRMAAGASRRKEKILLLMIDVNDFKEINDSYGHQAGDVVLRNIANALNYLNDGVCKVIRWGGDEFLVLIPVKRRKGVPADMPAADDVDELMKELSAKMKKPITVTVGQASFPQDGRTLEDLLRHADQAMYRAKSRAQSRVIS
jgi:diguanylate cyclase (GGDEF)-like protein